MSLYYSILDLSQVVTLHVISVTIIIYKSLQVDLLQTRLKDLEENYIEKTVKLRLEGRIRELENKLELETTSKHRIEVS